MSKKPLPKKPLKNALVLTGIAFQMGLTMYLFVFLGKWLDATYNQNSKLYVVICTLLGLLISIYSVVKQLENFNKKR